VQGADSGVSITGRYALHGPIARGGMATVHLGRLMGPVGFARTVAIKRLHPQFATDPDFVSMFVDEARLAARVRSPYVVPTVDVIATGGELLLVMDYVAGESLGRLVRAATDAAERVPVPIAVAVMSGVLYGLHAAHEARSERNEPLGIVHRDVSPQNILVGTDGLARVLDFGVAKAAGRLQTTRDGQLKGKLSYMAPEQLRNEPVTRRADVYSASVVLWEAITGERLFASDSEGALVTSVLLGRVEAPSRAVSKASPGADDETMHAIEKLDAVVLRGLERDPARRFESAREMAMVLEASVRPATPAQVSEWLERIAGRVLADRAARVAAIESEGAIAAPADPALAAAEPGTQASSISVATNATHPDVRRSGRRAMIVLATGAVLALLGVTLIVRSTRSPAGALPPPELTATAASAAASAMPPAAPASFAPPATGSASAEHDPSAAPPTTPPTASSPRAAPAPAKRTVPRSDCNPPFTWDALGKKHYKAQCL
jgi:serine/threonine-protein kinase